MAEPGDRGGELPLQVWGSGAQPSNARLRDGDGYGLPACERGGFVDKMITFAVHSACAEAVEFGVTPQSTAGSTESGYPFVWAITWRVRSASWMLTNPSALQRAIS